ncbi:M1 family metallopeptidase [Olivibacter sp. XZL3]|uniref:M1 family metallopeptidase n=1 Tax=Olivibacter sp. XZL3 TaxID=1735116 RepID=UPI001064E739|nr:M1 family metallopeptidase [Olivibacter sp. XZL3]
MPKNFLLFAVACLLLSGSCATTKHVDIPPVTIFANAPNADIYQGSYPIKVSIKHTDLDLHFDWERAQVLGKATLTLQSYFYPQDSVILDANGFELKEVSRETAAGRVKVPFSYNGKKLAIALDRKYSRDETFKLFIDYIAKPNELEVGKDISSPDDRGLYFIEPDTVTGVPRQLWSQGETECNANWFPTMNNTMLKMTQRIALTVPDSMVTLSNGLLVETMKGDNGMRTDVWKQDLPHAPYLVMIAAGVFDIVKDQWRGKEVSYYMEPEFAPYAPMIFGKTPEMMEFYSRKLGVDFPWDKYAQIVVRNFVSGAMENTSASVFFDRMNMTPADYKDETYEDIVAHELFHHWFGDLVTAESWANLPLNESFATYGEYLWLEHKYGKEAADMHALNDQLSYFAKDKNKELDVIRFDYADREQMFDEVSYQKGGRILHMLRDLVGEEAFFAALQLYLKNHAYQSVEIHDLRLAFEQVTGQDLNWFFNQWFLASGHPVLEIKTDYAGSTKQVLVRIAQKQDLSNTPLYKLPLAIDIYVDDHASRQSVTLTKQEQTFRFPLAKAPQWVNVDAKKCVLAQKEQYKSIDEWAYQYHHGSLFMDRFEALQHLKDKIDSSKAKEVVRAALTDKAWIIRLMALRSVENLSAGERKSIYPTIKKMAIDDARSYVRASAVMLLRTHYKAYDSQEVLKMAAQDDAPSVQQALRLKN